MVTDDDEVAKLARRLRFHGSDDKQTFVEVGYNSRLDELQAAVLRILLPELDGWTAARRAGRRGVRAPRPGRARRRCPQPVDGAEHVYHLYVVRSRARGRAGGRAHASGASARAATTACPSHLQPATARFAPTAELPGTDEAARTSLALPMGTGARSEDAVREVVEACASGST